ncbi:MAG TPA: Na-translocating system protein MpsC family protein [Solirubrobacteraceae bacterium]|nr:Na-translocating system protein MpsC family protein [Solirubrobacteraceae bacterium]
MNAALTSAIVGIHTTHLGRGPSSASTFHNGNVVAVLMRDVMSQVERTIALSGNRHAVSSMRQLFREAMKQRLHGGRGAVDRP